MKAEQLETNIFNICKKYTTNEQSKIVSKLITLAEEKGVHSHGLHYFLWSVLPLIKEKKTKTPNIQVKGNFVYSNGENCIGLVNTYNCIKKASKIAQSKGISLVIIKNPGKVGALRIYCPELMEKSQLVLMFKNTAPTACLENVCLPFVGTNPICFGLPDSNYIYDTSITTVATNKLRLYKKMDKTFDSYVGLDKDGKLSREPKKILKGGCLLPFSYFCFPYKSFFLGITIDLMSALAGGKTSIRVGESCGKRLYSKEGMIILVIDSKVFPNYNDYLKEKDFLLNDLKEFKVPIPGTKNIKNIRLLEKDIKEMQKELKK